MTKTAINHYYNITVFKHIPIVSAFQDLWVHKHNDGFKFLMGQTVEDPGEHLRSGRVNRTESEVLRNEALNFTTTTQSQLLSF